MQRVYTDDGHGSGKVTPVGLSARTWVSGGLITPPTEPSLAARLVGPIVSPFFLTRGDVNDLLTLHHDAALAALDDPAKIIDLEQDPALDKPARKLASLGLLESTPVSAKYIEAVHVGHARSDATRAVIAAHRFRAANGEFPESLDRLVPKYLDTLPQDPFDPGQPLKYLRTDTGFTIYSVGADGEDNNATPFEGQDKASVRDLSLRFQNHAGADRADWILFPPEGE